MPDLRYDNRVAIVTGAGNGLGKQYAKFLASRGAKVVVNDLGGTFNGKPGASAAVADIVVKEIKDAGGIAVANYNNVLDGDQIVKTAVDAFGRVDILINNAGILRDVTLRNMKDEDWDVIMDVHVHGAFKTARAAWPYMRKQKYGRVINTSSSSGLFGNFGQSNYAAAKMALVGLSETMAKEGVKYNIYTNVLAPGAASRLTQTVWSPEMMDLMKPDWVVPLVGTLVNEQCQENGSIFEAAAGHYSKIRWERTKGFLANPQALTADLVLNNWTKITDWAGAEHPSGGSDQLGLFEKAKTLASRDTSDSVSFKDRVVLVTGGGAGLGRSYALYFAKLGAKVAVNDVTNAEKVAEEIKQNGGEAISITTSVEDGASVVKAVTDHYSRVDVVINNAGVLRDKAFMNMTDEQWHTVLRIHLRGTYLVTRAAFPWMLKQRYGRIVNISSTSGVYGNFGQANYAAAKCGIVGFTKTIAREGAKYNIIVNTVCPSAGTNMTRTVWPPELVDAIRPDYVAPLIAALTCESPPKGATGQIYEAGGGWFAATRWQRARGVDFEHAKDVPSVEAVRDAFAEICNFDNDQADNPDTPQEGSKYTQGNVAKNPKVAGLFSQEQRENRKYISKIQQAMEMKPIPSKYTYDDKDVILYNISLGAKRTDLNLVYENDDNFSVLPTFGIVPTYFSKMPFDTKDIIPNYDQRMLLHGEQYLEIRSWPIPTSGTLTTETRLIEVVDKGNAALVRRGATTKDTSGKEVFYNESLSFIRGSGGFGGQKKPSDRGAATAANTLPKRQPDKVVEEKTSPDIAALYRLLGDRNPLHIDPKFSEKGGFKEPILHGLATFGISGKHVYQAHGPFKNIKVRFSGTVLPGETIVTEMWKEGNKVLYQVKIKESGKVVISGAGAELMGGGSKL